MHINTTVRPGQIVLVSHPNAFLRQRACRHMFYCDSVTNPGDTVLSGQQHGDILAKFCQGSWKHQEQSKLDAKERTKEAKVLDVQAAGPGERSTSPTSTLFRSRDGDESASHSTNDGIPNMPSNWIPTHLLSFALWGPLAGGEMIIELCLEARNGPRKKREGNSICSSS